MATYAYFCVAPWCIGSIGHAPSWAEVTKWDSHLIGWHSALDNEGMSLYSRPWYDLIANASNVIGHHFCSGKSHQPLLSMLYVWIMQMLNMFPNLCIICILTQSQLTTYHITEIRNPVNVYMQFPWNSWNFNH